MPTNTPETREFAPVEALEAAFGWWREAGVDSDYTEEPVSWLAKPEVEGAVTAQRPSQGIKEPKQTPLERAFCNIPAAERIGGDKAGWPQDLAAFREWWMNEKTLASVGPDHRLPPRGIAGAKVWMVIPQPFEYDSETLLSGEAARLVDAILRAIDVAPHEVYFASALPAPVALADWTDLSTRGLGEVLLHHIALSFPMRVIAFGRALAPLFGVAPENAREPAVVKLGEAVLPLMIAPELAELARSPDRRRNFWKRWLEWTV